MGKKGFICKSKWGIESEGSDQENVGPLRRRLTWNGGEIKVREWKHGACLEWLKLNGRKGKQTAACLKRLFTCKSEKYCRLKKRGLSIYYDSLTTSTGVV